jgi:hypothetical protein
MALNEKVLEIISNDHLQLTVILFEQLLGDILHKNPKFLCGLHFTSVVTKSHLI